MEDLNEKKFQLQQNNNEKGILTQKEIMEDYVLYN